MSIQEKLQKWAEETVKKYHKIADPDRDGVNIAYYTQSDLSLLSEEPELMIIGINPGSSGTYQDQRKNKNWSYLYNNPLDKNHLYKGNYCHEEGKPSNWENHRKWSYWNGLKKCLSKTKDLYNTIEDDSKIIITNASFFSTERAKEISDTLLKETIPFTLDLIDISNPKHVIFLSGKKCFERLFKLSNSSKIFQFEYKNVCGNIYVGVLNGKLCIGIPHPAYKTREELNLVASVLPHIIYTENYESIDIASIQKECAIQIKQFYERNKKEASQNANREQHRLNKEYILQQLTTSATLIPYEQKGKTIRYKLNDKYGITITIVNKGYIGIRHINYDSTDYNVTLDKDVISIRESLKKCGYNICERAWIGVKPFSLYGQSDDEVIENILNEISVLAAI